ncbi:MAG: CHRD domain-containing protein [Caldilineaceae bacterium]|nr:CHRD domain-containing protein [Caldilineaceae bacterium]
MRKSYRILSVLMVFSFLLSMATPALAQDSWPSGRGAAGSTTPATPPPFEVERGPVSAQGLPTQDMTEPESNLPPGLRRVTPGEAAQIMSHFPQRDWRAPSGVTIPAGAHHHSSSQSVDVGDNQLLNLVVHLEMPSLVERMGPSTDGTARTTYAAQVAREQSRVSTEIRSLGDARVVFTFNNLSSGIAVQAPASSIGRLANIPGVSRVTRVPDYTVDLHETVPFVGAQFLQDLGITGAGVKVAVLDSGIDFSHLAFGGPGTVAGWEEAYFGSDVACDPNVLHDPDCAYAKPADPALFGPNAPRVKGGYDWLGEAWPSGPVLPDPNPIDYGGHGTNVADIIGGLGYPAGTNEDGDYPAKGQGVAPGADIYAFKVCASFSTSCNGLAILKGLDSSADLDGNPATYDPADVVNMSLGAPYGQPEDDSVFFTNQLVELGVIVVASAGNSADKPFIVGSPSMADGAISVAQMAVPSATRYPLFYTSSAVSGTISTAVFQNWSTPPGNTIISGTLAYGNSNGTNLNGCLPYTDDMTGKVVLADRGVCNFTAKAANASAAGAVLSLIGLIAPGDPFEGGDGGERPINIPSFMILQSTSNMLKAEIANGVVVGVDPADGINLASTITGSSSRGPRNHDGKIKPDITAPGASVSASVATGAGSGPFGGTSGAAPMVSGVAALLKSVYGYSLLPQQYKALLMNTGDPVYNGVPRVELSPFTRIGGGQVNARAAYTSRLLAWDSTDSDPLAWTGSMSFGYVPASEYQAYTRTLTIQNLGPIGQGITIDSFFRSNEDFAQGVFVTPLVSTAFIPAGATIEVPVLLEIYPAGRQQPPLGPLHPWVVNRGSLGANGLALQFQEYDGYVRIRPPDWQAGGAIHVVWQVLPKAVADIQVNQSRALPGSAALVNSSSGVEGYTDIFSLIAADANDYNFEIGNCASIGQLPGCSMSPVDIKEVGVRSYTDSAPHDFLEFAITVWDQPYRSGQYPPAFYIYIDSNADGTDDFVIFNADLTRNASDGRNVVFRVNLNTNVAQPWYFIDSTFNSNNFILPMDAASIGVTPGQPFRFKVFAFDAYFGGPAWDCAPKIGFTCAGTYQYTPGAARFNVAEANLFPTIPPNDQVEFAWTSSPAADMASPSQVGLLFLHRNAHVGRESDHLLLTDSFVAAEGLELTAQPSVALIGQPITLTATVTNSVNMVEQHKVWFSDGTFTAQLSGINEVPPVTTTASGLATFVVDFETGVTNYTLEVTDLISPTAAHIHVGPAGVNGGVIHWLYHSTGANATNQLPATGVITLTQPQILQLLDEGLYVNVHTTNNPGGEIRGQIEGAIPAYTDANGQASTVINSPVPLQKTMYAVTAPDLVASAEITFAQAMGLSLTAEPSTIMFGESVTVTAIVTGSHGGRLEGETVLVTDGVLTAQLSGANEVPANDSTATGLARFIANPSMIDLLAGTIPVSYTLTVEGLETPVTGAHIHAGGAGVNGPVLYPLQIGEGSIQMQLAHLPAVLTGQTYVNVHTQAIPGGEIRGQILGAAMGVTDENGVATISFTPNYIGMVLLYGAPLTNPTLLRSTMVMVNQEYTINVSANPVEGGTVSGGGTVLHGQTVTVTATANDGYVFINWTEGETVVSTDASYSFTAMGNRTLVANFGVAPSYEIYMPIIFR